jgi:hypothetical protein
MPTELHLLICLIFTNDFHIAHLLECLFNFFSGNFSINLIHHIFSEWLDWQRDEKKRIRIVDLIDSVRKNAIRKPVGSSGINPAAHDENNKR